ncbi:UNVERIFIED_CONTAM: hypothetical protein K2H54_067070 [Gekko kuhli]
MPGHRELANGVSGGGDARPTAGMLVDTGDRGHGVTPPAALPRMGAGPCHRGSPPGHVGPARRDWSSDNVSQPCPVLADSPPTRWPTQKGRHRTAPSSHRHIPAPSPQLGAQKDLLPGASGLLKRYLQWSRGHQSLFTFLGFP